MSAEGEIFSGEASMVFAPAVMGDIGIAPRHAPLLTTLKPGEVRVQVPGGEEQFFYVSGGAIEVPSATIRWMGGRLAQAFEPGPGLKGSSIACGRSTVGAASASPSLVWAWWRHPHDPQGHRMLAVPPPTPTSAHPPEMRELRAPISRTKR